LRPYPRQQAVVCAFGVFAGTVLPAGCAGALSTGLRGKHPAGNCMLEGGRNSLLESAQQGTLLSVAISAFPRQSNGLPPMRCNYDCNRKFIKTVVGNGLSGRVRWNGYLKKMNLLGLMSHRVKNHRRF
jgi:hypothetical protein